MPVYFDYALKVSICLAVVFLFYNVLLRRITYHTWNRYFLLFFSVLSFIVPLINVSAFEQTRQIGSVSFIYQVPSINSFEILGEAANTPAAFNYWPILSLVVIIVTCILVLRLIIQLISIKRISSKATLLSSGEVKIYQHPDPIIPFSFLNSIYINADNYDSNELSKIIHHETVHVQQKHTIDVLITEIIFILNWYNPFAWLLKQAVRENLEFIADEAVIGNGTDKQNYQYLLLKVTGLVPSPITNSLKFSSLKNRILMMNKAKTSRFHLLKFALLIPMISLVLLAFRNDKEVENTTSPIENVAGETYTLSTLTYSIPDNKVKNIVLQNTHKSYLKAGSVFNLSQIRDEKIRLQNLLEKSGYRSLKSNAIRFMIDTTLMNKNFSVEVNIDVEPAVVSNGNNEHNPVTKEIDGASNEQKDPNKKAAKVGNKPISANPFDESRINSYLKIGAVTNEGC